MKPNAMHERAEMARQEQVRRYAAANHRTEEQQRELDARLDAMDPFDFFRLMHECFPPVRVVELVGWAVIWGLRGVESVGEMRKSYEDAGGVIGRSSAYRAAADYKFFADYILAQTGRQREMKDILRGMVNGIATSG